VENAKNGHKPWKFLSQCGNGVSFRVKPRYCRHRQTEFAVRSVAVSISTQPLLDGEGLTGFLADSYRHYAPLLKDLAGHAIRPSPGARIEQAVAYLADHPPEDQEDVSPGPLASKPRVTVEQAIEACLCDAVRRSVESSALKKLESFFRKQVLAWTRVEGVAYLGG
jgi:hypothetical protein